MSSQVKFAQSLQLFRIKKSGRYKKENLPFDVSQRLQQTHRLLVCLPAEPSEAILACRLIPAFKTRFGQCEITVVQEMKGGLPVVDLPDIDVMTYSLADISRFCTLKKGFQHKLAAASFDLVMDLSIPFHFNNVLITWTSGAGLRVGFYHPDREAFYNFMLRQKAEAPPEYAYESLVNYLLSFK
ncbi:hypothetical protein JW998_11820 [candidate division KSB1 bacterium]|nr:hypothetical protein [candidate division KSB1 bacterium]